MISKNQIKFVRSLHQAKYRKQEKLFIAEGPKIVEELLKSNFTLQSIYATQAWLEANSSMIPKKLEVFEISSKELERISTLKTPNQVLALVSIPEIPNPKPSPPKDLTLILDDIKDPGNLGTIIRTADWFGIKKVICSENCVEVYNPKVIQSSMGSIARVEVVYNNLVNLFSNLPKGVKIYGTVLDGKNIYKTELLHNSYLVIGSESHGISKEILRYITDFITIPTYSSSSHQAESLNASIAAAISCAEFRRQYK